MKNHGFVINIRTGWLAPVDKVSHSKRDNTSSVASEWLRLTARPFATTPEAERETQPLVADDLLLAYTGRVDNRRDIADRLGQPQLAAAADGEVLAAAYRAWGQQLPLKVLGEYSFVVVDRRSGHVLAGLDSLGVGRLFYREQDGQVWIASDLDFLLEQLPDRPPVDRRCLVEYLGCWARIPGRTVYAGIREEEPAHIIVHDGKQLTRRRYWQPDPEREIQFSSDGEYDEALRSLVFEGVRAALRSNSPVSLDLSGGLDSSTVAAVAATLTSSGEGAAHGLSAFSLLISYPPEDNESAFQRAFLERHPMPHRVLLMDEHPVFQHIDDDPPLHPFIEILGGSRLRATRAMFAQDGTRVALTGLGGDQAFCGDNFPPVFLGERLRRWELMDWARGVHAWARTGDRSVWNLIWRCSRGPAPSKFAGRREPSLPVWLAPEVTKAALRRLHQIPGAALHQSAARELQYRLTLRMREQLRFNGMTWEERHPLLYRPLVEFMLAVPWEQKVLPDQDRVLQRRAFEGFIPDTIRLRTGKGEGKALLINGVRQHWPLVNELLEESRIARLELIDLPRFRAACERLRHGLLDRHMGFFMAAFSLEAWLRWAERRGLRISQATS